MSKRISRTKDPLDLQHFEVVDVLVLQLGVELDLLEHHGAGEEHVHELAVDGAGAQLLDLGVLSAQAVVDPGQHVVSRGGKSEFNVSTFSKETLYHEYTFQRG